MLPRDVSGEFAIWELVRENSNVDFFGRSDKAQYRITEDTITPRVSEAMANENLSDALLPGEIDNRKDRVAAFQNFGCRSRFFSCF
jgi:hypothetical protein